MIIEPVTLLVEAAFGGRRPGPFGHGGTRPDITPDEISAARARLGHPIPEPLVDFYTVAGRFDGIMEAYFRFLAPDELHVHHGHLVFCHENQHVMEWGVRLDDLATSNPPVLCQLTDGPDHGVWELESPALSAFLLGIASWQAALSADESGEVDLAADDLPSLLQWFAPLGGPDQAGPPVFGFADRDNWMVAAYDTKESKLIVGTSVEDGLEDFEDRTSLEVSMY